MITLLNTSIITAYGTFVYKLLSLDKAKELVQPYQCPNCYGGEPCQMCGSSQGGGMIYPLYKSAIGHESTAEIMSELLGVDVPVNRQNYTQNIGDKAIVFKLKTRAPEGVILSRKEIEKIGYEFGLLTRTA